MAAQYELLSQLLKSGGRLDMGQELFYKFYQAFVLKDRWLQYIGGVGTTLLVTAIALALGIVLGSVVALVRVAHDQQRPGHKNPVLGFFNIICEIYTTIIRGTPMMVQLLIMSMVIFANSRNFTMVGALALGINSGAYVSEIIRGGLMAVDPGQMEAGRSLGLNYMTTMVVIIIPQAIRAVLPALGNEFIVLLKDTSLITTIGGIVGTVVAVEDTEFLLSSEGSPRLPAPSRGRTGLPSAGCPCRGTTPPLPGLRPAIRAIARRTCARASTSPRCFRPWSSRPRTARCCW